MATLFRWALKTRKTKLASFSTTSKRLDDLKRTIAHSYKVNNFEKKLLVWTKKYKTIEEIPAHVTPDVVEMAKSKMRIRVANIMMVCTLLACVLMVWSGKRARSRGETLTTINQEWHRIYNEKEDELETSHKEQK